MIPPPVPRQGGPLSRAVGRAGLALLGWRRERELPRQAKFVAIVAPHSSNWDFVVGLLAKYAIGVRASFLGKHTLFRWPFGAVFRYWGGIPVIRDASHDVVEQSVAEFARRDALVLALAPESVVVTAVQWKLGRPSAAHYLPATPPTSPRRRRDASMKRSFLTLLLALLIVAPRTAVRAQARPSAALPAEPGSELTVVLLTMGVGKQVWEQFGHNAIWIRDMSLPPSAGGGTDSVYHWGLFDFSQPHFIPRFLKGEMLYSMGGFTLASTMDDYHRLDRSVWAQELDLTPAQKLALRDYIRWNELPEHRGYYYNYYLDNCSTRVRDALDRVLGGTIRARFAGQTRGETYRSHTLRLTQVDPLLATGIDIGAGRPTDRELTVWEEMFLPRILHDGIRELRVTDAAGVSRPLVKREAVLYRSTQFEEPDRAPQWLVPFTLIGLLVGAAFTLLGLKAARGSARARFWAGVVFAVWAFIVGILGVLLTLLWTVTHHVAAHQNENLLLFNPLWLVLAVLVPMSAVKGRLARFTRGLTLGLVAVALLAPLLHLVGLSRQSNFEIIGLVLPAALAMAWTVLRGTTAR